MIGHNGTNVVLFSSEGHRQYVRSKLNTTFELCNVLSTIKQVGAKINVWVCFSYYGAGHLF